MTFFASPRTWFFLSLIWIAAVCFVSWNRWPQMSLDLSPTDPKTLDLYAIATLNHSVFYVLLALLGPMVLMVAMKLAQRRQILALGRSE
jgi:hypothetical protein